MNSKPQHPTHKQQIDDYAYWNAKLYHNTELKLIQQSFCFLPHVLEEFKQQRDEEAFYNSLPEDCLHPTFAQIAEQQAEAELLAIYSPDFDLDFDSIPPEDLRDEIEKYHRIKRLREQTLSPLAL